MNTSGWLQLGLYVVVLLLLAKPLGAYMAAVYEGRAHRAQRIGGPLERLIYRGAGVDPAREMGWIEYALAMLWFNLLGALVVYGLQRLQQWLPLNPQDMAAVSPDSAFNTAVSFATNTNWQGYGGETTMSYLTQMLGLAVQNFVSAATGMAVLVALIRGFARKEASGIGNFWADLVRSTRLHPAAAVDRAGAGAGEPGRAADVRQVRDGDARPAGDLRQPEDGPDGQPLKDEKGNPVTEKATATEQTIPLGPAASQIAIKQLGTNGGGFFNVNSAHPFENPTPLVELSRGAVDPADRRGALLHVRQDDRRHAPGLGAARRDDAHLRPAPRRRLRRRGRGQPGAHRARRGSGRHRDQSRRQHGRQGSALRRRQLGAVGGRHDRRRRTARSTRCTIRSCRSPGWSRCG